MLLNISLPHPGGFNLLAQLLKYCSYEDNGLGVRLMSLDGPSEGG
jgi:hypothetical protein